MHFAPRFARWMRASVFGVVGIVAAAPAISAQQPAGFLFKRPIASIALRAGYSMPSTNSEIFQFGRDSLTMAADAFNAFTIGGDLSIRATERIDIGASLSVSNASTRSEYRNWVDFDDLPIEQETRLTRVPVTANVKAYLLERGRSVGQFAWIPARWSPYVGVGGGWMWYQFEQSGDFVDFDTVDDPEGADIFTSTLVSDGWTPALEVFGGADLSLSTRMVVRGEARYTWASGDMGLDFVGVEDIDLAGLQFTLGLSVRF